MSTVCPHIAVAASFIIWLATRYTAGGTVLWQLFQPAHAKGPMGSISVRHSFISSAVLVHEVLMELLEEVADLHHLQAGAWPWPALSMAGQARIARNKLGKKVERQTGPIQTVTQGLNEQKSEWAEKRNVRRQKG